jgi:hypothetical protein
MYLFVFIESYLKIRAITYQDYLQFYKPNPKGIFVQCRYSDKRRNFNLKPSAPKNKPSQTNFDSNVAIRTFEACSHFAPPTSAAMLLPFAFG